MVVALVGVPSHNMAVQALKVMLTHNTMGMIFKDLPLRKNARVL